MGKPTAHARNSVDKSKQKRIKRRDKLKMDPDLKVWVGDALHEATGISDKTIAEFLMGLAKNAKSSNDFIDKIKATETIDINDKLTNFATDLYNKIPRGSTSGQKRKLENRQKEKAAMELQARNKSFKPLDDESEDEKTLPKLKKKKKSVKSSKAKSGSDSDEFDKMERDRKRDQEDVKAFSKRLLEKDKEKRRNVMEKSDKRGYDEAAKRLALEKEDKEKMLPELRKKSRRDYLAKREEDKLLEAEDDIADDEFLYDESQLTEREKADRKYKKTVVKLAKDHKNLKEMENVKRYKMPEDRKKGELDSYVEVDEKERVPNYEARKWEDEHLQKATYNFGAKDAKKKHAEKEKI